MIELALLKKEPAIETTLLIHPERLTDFNEYLEFLVFANRLMTEMGFDRDYQIASFHPDYCFEGSQPDDVTNYTNRSPYPMLHLLRESSVTKAVDRHGDAHSIPHNNMKCLQKLGLQHMSSLLNACF